MVDRVKYQTDLEYRAKILERNRLYRQRNREKVLALKKKYREENPGRVAEQKRQSRLKKLDEYKEKSQKYKEENKEQILSYYTSYREENKEQVAETKKNCYYAKQDEYKARALGNFENNKERYRANARAYYEANKDKYIFKAFLRKKKIKRATPPWLTEEMKAEIKHLFDTRPEGYHVDHMIPLQGETVCGLNVPWNLQHMKDTENISKGNKLI